jgi:DNA-directed RNA polymerase specialized sigma24 family protein
MNRLSTKQRAQIIAALVEGNSIRATCRMTGAAKGTVLKLVADIGKACAEYQDKVFRNLKCKRIQCDEIVELLLRKEKECP